jgi:hypothetical protein
MDDFVRIRATEAVLERHHFSSLGEAQERLSPPAFAALMREIGASIAASGCGGVRRQRHVGERTGSPRGRPERINPTADALVIVRHDGRGGRTSRAGR